MLAKEQILQGRVGEVLGIQSRVYNTRAQLMEILKRAPDATPVNDVLTYYVDMACWFLEGIRPVEVVARSQSKVFKAMGHKAADVWWAIITFENGAVVNLGVSYVLPATYPTVGQSSRFEIIGDEGVILLDADNKDSLLFTDRGAPHSYVPDHNINMMFMQNITIFQNIAHHPIINDLKRCRVRSIFLSLLGHQTNIGNGPCSFWI